MFKLLQTFLVVFIIYFIIRSIIRLIFPFFSSNNSQNEAQKAKKNEGKITINEGVKTNSHYKENEGEYIDFEEIKDTKDKKE